MLIALIRSILEGIERDKIVNLTID